MRKEKMIKELIGLICIFIRIIALTIKCVAMLMDSLSEIAFIVAESMSRPKECVIYGDAKAWYKDGKFHRDDGPAIIYRDGTQLWYQNGKLHREDGPAIIYPDGAQFWYQNGQRHREDGPAVILNNGKQFWFKNGIPFVSSDQIEIYSNGFLIELKYCETN